MGTYARPGGASRQVQKLQLRQLALYPLVEFRHVDHHPLVRAVADQLALVARLDAECESAAIDLFKCGGGRDAHADRRGGDVPDVEHRAEALIAGREEALNRSECRRLHQIDHHRRGEHADRAAAHARRRVLARNDKPGLPSEAGLELSQLGRAHAAMLALLLLAVVLLAVDTAAFAVLGLLHARLLVRSNFAVGPGARFLLADMRFAALEATCFARGQAAALHALLDAALLVDIALHVGLHALRGGRVRVTRLRVMLLAIDVAAHRVLLTLEARLLRRAQLAVLHGARLVALDARFLVLEARRFAGGELAGLQPLLDALLLVRVPLNRPCLRERRAAKTDGKGRGDHAVCKFHLVAPPNGWWSPLQRARRSCVDRITSQLVTTCIIGIAWRFPGWSSLAAASVACGQRRRSSVRRSS